MLTMVSHGSLTAGASIPPNSHDATFSPSLSPSLPHPLSSSPLPFSVIPFPSHPKATISVKRVKIEESYYEGPIGSHQRSFDFWGSGHISTSGFASMATDMVVFALFLPVQPSNQYYMVQMDFLAANHVRIIRLIHKAHCAAIFAIAQLSCNIYCFLPFLLHQVSSMIYSQPDWYWF